MRNKFVKMLDEAGIRSGVAREFMNKENYKPAIDALTDETTRLKAQIKNINLISKALVSQIQMDNEERLKNGAVT